VAAVELKLMKYVIFCLLVCSAAAFAQQGLGRIVADGPLHVVALGDFGSGNSYHAEVARAMANRNGEERFDIGISLRDNYYRCGVRDTVAPCGRPVGKSCTRRSASPSTPASATTITATRR
jgi:hypothetical protein